MVAQVALGKHHDAGQDVDGIVEVLAVPEPTYEVVEEFFEAARQIMQRSCGIPPDQVGAGRTTRFEAPAYEVVRLWVLEDLAVGPDGERYLPDQAWARGISLVVAHPAVGTRTHGVTSMGRRGRVSGVEWAKAGQRNVWWRGKGGKCGGRDVATAPASQGD